MDPKHIIPEHSDGVETNTETEVELKSEEEAKDFFAIVKERLLHINNWQQYAGSGTANFQLTDEKGHPVDRIPRKGDHFKIDIPAPGTVTGEGNDWVQIEEIMQDENCTGILVRPATNPMNDRNDVAHFFDKSSTSSFIIKREKNKVIAGVYGRNEKPNTHTETIVDKIRNTTVAVGAMSGFSKLQWKSLVNGLLKR